MGDLSSGPGLLLRHCAKIFRDRCPLPVIISETPGIWFSANLSAVLVRRQRHRIHKRIFLGKSLQSDLTFRDDISADRLGQSAHSGEVGRYTAVHFVGRSSSSMIHQNGQSLPQHDPVMELNGLEGKERRLYQTTIQKSERETKKKEWTNGLV